MIRASRPKQIIMSHTSRSGCRCTYICILLPASPKPPRYQGDLGRHDRASRYRSRTLLSIGQADPVLARVLLADCQSRRIARIRCSRTMHPRPGTLVSTLQAIITTAYVDLTNSFCTESRSFILGLYQHSIHSAIRTTQRLTSRSHHCQPRIHHPVASSPAHLQAAVPCMCNCQ
jgi:hypothetical protein